MVPLLFLLLISFAHASTCGLYEFQATPYIDDDRILLKLHEKTQSEILIHVKTSDYPDLAPYIGVPVKGEVLIDPLMGPREYGAKKFSKLDYGIPDPLNPMLHHYLRLLKEEKCQ